MILENEFTVAADPDTVWRHLLDVARVAECLPGASVTPTAESNVYDGSMRLRIGPMTVEYRGRAELCDIDEHSRSAVIELQAREARGQGTAMARVHNQLEPIDGGTRVRARTDLKITGPQAQFGRGVIEDVGKRVMNEFSRRLEEQIARDAAGPLAEAQDGEAQRSAAAASARDASGATCTPAGGDALDVGALIPTRVKLAAAALLVAVLALAILVRGRRR